MLTNPRHPATINLPIGGMDCAGCARHVEGALARLPGVAEVQVLLSAERATVTYDATRVNLDQMRVAVEQAGYSVKAVEPPSPLTTRPHPSPLTNHQSPSTKHQSRLSHLLSPAVLSWGLLGFVALVVIGAAIGERLGVFERVVEAVPWWLPAVAVIVGGWPVFRGVFLAARQRQITSHSLMTLGTVAAIGIGQWTTAALLVFFMRFGAWVETLTNRSSRQALQNLVAQQPAVAHVLRAGEETVVPIEQVTPGEIILVRPGERIPVDGTVMDGHAPVNQAPITGESTPVDKTPGDVVFAATLVQAGFLKILTTGVGQDTTFGRIVRLVEEAETHKAPVQRFADRFASYYMPLVLGIAIITYLVTGQLLNAVAVLAVSCACAITMATPVVVLASVSAAARQGLLIKGGLALEQLARVDTVVTDKTGTLTWGAPRVTEIVVFNGVAEDGLLRSVASLETRSEHPLAQAIRQAAVDRGLVVSEPDDFTPLPGRGLLGRLGGDSWAVGNRQLLADQRLDLGQAENHQAQTLEATGRTVFFVAQGQSVVGLIALADTVRPEVREALENLRELGIRRVLLLTGDNERVAHSVAQGLGIDYHANLLPDDKITLVKKLQAEGRRVLMIGDGVNDAPALAQADVGLAMGLAGSDVALDAAQIALMRDDWRMVPEAIRIARRSTQTIRQNLLFTAAFNTAGVALAFLGLLPPVWAAAAQSIPDVAIMLNSARLARTPGGQPKD